jgi:hypothetical protein
VKAKHLSVLIIFIFNGIALQASESDIIDLHPINDMSYSNIDDDWIKVNNRFNYNPTSFSLKTNKNITFGDELALAWNLSDSLSLNLSIFENQSNRNYLAKQNTSPQNQQKSLNKFISQPTSIDVNKNLSGYKFGISSKLDMGKSYIVNINLDYGQLDDANLVGFNSSKVNTSSFELGIRKSKFGASLLTDSYLENNTDVLNHTRVGIELDWYFTEDTIISFGSKQRYNNKSYIDQTSSLDNLTGNVQYIKFQLNL